MIMIGFKAIHYSREIQHTVFAHIHSCKVLSVADSIKKESKCLQSRLKTNAKV